MKMIDFSAETTSDILTMNGNTTQQTTVLHTNYDGNH